MSEPAEPTLAQKLRTAFSDMPLRADKLDLVERVATRLDDIEEKLANSQEKESALFKQVSELERRLATVAQAERERCIETYRRWITDPVTEARSFETVIRALAPRAGELDEDHSTPPIPGLPVSPEIRARVEAEQLTPRTDEDEDRCRECGLHFQSRELCKELERECAGLSAQLDIAKDEFNTAIGVSDGLKDECERLRAVADMAKKFSVNWDLRRLRTHASLEASGDALVEAVRALERGGT